MKYLNVSSLSFNPSKCVTCLKCIEVCPHQVFRLDNGIQCNKATCIECGACQMNCPTGALSVNAGTGCASAILSDYFSKYKFLQRFIKNSC